LHYPYKDIIIALNAIIPCRV